MRGIAFSERGSPSLPGSCLHQGSVSLIPGAGQRPPAVSGAVAPWVQGGRCRACPALLVPRLRPDLTGLHSWTPLLRLPEFWAGQSQETLLQGRLVALGGCLGLQAPGWPSPRRRSPWAPQGLHPWSWEAGGSRVCLSPAGQPRVGRRVQTVPCSRGAAGLTAASLHSARTECQRKSV